MAKTIAEKNPDATPRRLAHSIADVTKIVGLGRSFIYEEIKAGHLRIRKAGRRSLIFEDDLRAWLQRLPLRRI
jgi:excisionase family DNA binding protein